MIKNNFKIFEISSRTLLQPSRRYDFFRQELFIVESIRKEQFGKEKGAKQTVVARRIESEKRVLFQKGEERRKEIREGDTKGSQGRNELSIENNRLGYVFRRDTSLPSFPFYPPWDQFSYTSRSPASSPPNHSSLGTWPAYCLQTISRFCTS